MYQCSKKKFVQIDYQEAEKCMKFEIKVISCLFNFNQALKKRKGIFRYSNVYICIKQK